MNVRPGPALDRRAIGSVGRGLAWACAAIVVAALAGELARAQAQDVGATMVSIPASVSVSIPAWTDLRLDAAELIFDLAGDLQSADQVCTYGSVAHDPPEAAVPAPGFPVAVYPLGTGYRRRAPPAIEVEGRAPVTHFPPLDTGAEGDAIKRSDEAFVCYRSFLLRHRTSSTQWHVTVERPIVLGGGREPMSVYVRDAGCSEGGELEGLFPLHEGESILLASHEASTACADGDVVVLAVEPGVARAGTSQVRLVYSLMTPTFEAAP